MVVAQTLNRRDTPSRMGRLPGWIDQKWAYSQEQAGIDRPLSCVFDLIVGQQALFTHATAKSSHCKLRLSGGADNAEPEASLGGAMSGQRIGCKSVTGLSTNTGVTLDDAPGCANGPGTLLFSSATQSFVWIPPRGLAGVPTPVTGNGRLAVPGSSGWLFLTVDMAALPDTDQSDTVTVSPIQNALFADISPLASPNTCTHSAKLGLVVMIKDVFS